MIIKMNLSNWVNKFSDLAFYQKITELEVIIQL